MRIARQIQPDRPVIRSTHADLTSAMRELRDAMNAAAIAPNRADVAMARNLRRSRALARREA